MVALRKEEKSKGRQVSVGEAVPLCQSRGNSGPHNQVPQKVWLTHSSGRAGMAYRSISGLSS
jgi:hypothetical protein